MCIRYQQGYLPSVQALRDGNTKHDFNTCHCSLETRSQFSIRVLTNNDERWLENVSKSRPKSDSYLYPPRQSCSHASRLMYERAPHSPNATQHTVAHDSFGRAKTPETKSYSDGEWRNLRRARKDAARLRERLFRQRLRLKEHRNALQEERIDVTEGEADLMTFIRQNLNERIISEPSLARNLYTELESKRAALETKRDELGALQYEYDQAEVDHNLEEAELVEKEQTFESLVSDLLGLSYSSEEDSSSTSSGDIPQHEGSDTTSGLTLQPDRGELLTSRLPIKSESTLADIQRSFPKVGPQVNWWILHTFGCSPIDYVQRAQDKALLRQSKGVTPDDETWARVVFDFWRREKETEATVEHSYGSWDESSNQELPEPQHIRRFTIGESHLLLSSESTKARCTLDNYDVLFPADPGFRHTSVIDNDSMSTYLDLLSRRDLVTAH